jgi:hypothetical protein
VIVRHYCPECSKACLFENIFKSLSILLLELSSSRRKENVNVIGESAIGVTLSGTNFSLAHSDGQSYRARAGKLKFLGL